MTSGYRQNSADLTTRSSREIGRGFNTRGFSLSELLIIIAIIGILAVIAGYSWQRYVTNANLRSAAREIASDFSMAREKALKENQNFTITFDVTANQYTISPGATVKKPTFFGSDISLTGANFGIGGTTITFLPRGTASAGNVTLTNSRGSTATIVVNITGKNYVQFATQ
ncbi:MAG: type II transport protein [Syntrophaceae bacterium]|nr:type II transport protein [Syntrophaceae bacterium]